eukprot:351095-Hanusia_phi.AAC.1
MLYSTPNDVRLDSTPASQLKDEHPCLSPAPSLIVAFGPCAEGPARPQCAADSVTGPALSKGPCRSAPLSE